MRGSSHANRTSETNVPIRVNILSKSINAPARNISCVVNADNNIGPVVGKLNTVATMIDPDTSVGNNQPAVLINGFNATRTGYFKITFHSGNPLARAVRTYGFLSSSSRFARIIRIRLAAPAVPKIIIGIQR